MFSSFVRLLAAGLLLGLGACAPYLYQHPLATQPARLGAELRSPAQWGALGRLCAGAVVLRRALAGAGRPIANEVPAPTP